MDTTPAYNGDSLNDAQITALSKHFFNNVYVMDNGAIRKLDVTKDTQSMCFTKAKIDALFAKYPGADTLTIHLGMHSSSIFTPDDPRYEDKMMVALEVKIAGAPAPITGPVAMDGAHLCPPFTNC